MDYILNGQASGSVASTLLNNGFDVRAMRPWVGKDKRSYIAMNNEAGKLTAMVTNAPATLRQDEWKQIDDAVVMAARDRLTLVADLRSRGLTLDIPNGMSKTVLETSVMGDITGATLSMDPARKSEGDRPEFDIANLPLPVIHKDFHFTARQIAVSRNGGNPLDTTVAEMAAVKVAEEAEKLAVGNSAFNGFTFGGGSIYGITTHPGRQTKVLVSPEESDWTPAQTVTNVLQMRQQAVNERRYGPYVLYVSPNWDIYLDEDYSASKGDNTLRDRLMKLSKIVEIKTLDYLENYDMVLVQMTRDVIREVIGMDITTLQWPTDGGMVQHFKVMAIMVPQIRLDIDDNSGIIHGVAA